MKRAQYDALMSGITEGVRMSAKAMENIEAGRTAFLNGVVVGDNPHDEDSSAHWEWMQGWAEEGLKKARGKVEEKHGA